MEQELDFYKNQGLQIIRYSSKERTIPSYCGEDTIIRFYKDPEEYKDWNGKKLRIINFTQSLQTRGDHCGYRVFMSATDGFKRKVYGPGNDDLGKISGGLLTHEELKKQLQDNRVYFYHGTTPASYTLSFIEAMMTAIPVVAAGPAFSKYIYNLETNEIPDIIQNGRNGFVSDNVEDLKSYIKLLFENEEEAKRIGEEGRKTAISLFGKETIKKQWKDFLGE